MRPLKYGNDNNKKQEQEISKAKYVGIGTLVVGFVCFILAGLFESKYLVSIGLTIMIAPILCSVLIGFLVGCVWFVLKGVGCALEIIVLLYTGTDRL